LDWLLISVIQLNRTESSPPWGRCREAAEGFSYPNEMPLLGRCPASAGQRGFPPKTKIFIKIIALF